MKNQKSSSYPHLETVILGSESPAGMADCSQFEDTVVIYNISRLETELCLTDRIAHDLRIAPDNPFCSCQMDRMLFSVEGYDDDPRELFQIPEFREFIRGLNKHEIPWLYFTCLETMWLQVMALCLVPNAAAITDTKRGRTRMAFTGPGFSDFFLSQLDPFTDLCEMLGVSQEEMEARSRAVCGSFGMQLPQL